MSTLDLEILLRPFFLGLRANVEIGLDMNTVLPSKIVLGIYMMVKQSGQMNSLLAQKSPANLLIRKGPVTMPIAF